MKLKRIRLTLARDHNSPNGSRKRGYDIIAPVDEQGRLVAEEWRKRRHECRVRRFWAGEEEMGRLTHNNGDGWTIDCDPANDEDDEQGFKFDEHKFTPGETVSVREHDGKLRTFCVASIVEMDEVEA